LQKTFEKYSTVRPLGFNTAGAIGAATNAPQANLNQCKTIAQQANDRELGAVHARPPVIGGKQRTRVENMADALVSLVDDLSG